MDLSWLEAIDVAAIVSTLSSSLPLVFVAWLYTSDARARAKIERMQAQTDIVRLENHDRELELQIQNVYLQMSREDHAELKLAQTRILETNEKVAAQAVTIANGRAEADRLILTLQEKEARIGVLVNEMSKMKDERDALQARIDLLQTQMLELAQRMTAVEAELTIEKTLRIAAEAARVTAEAERDRVKMELAEVRAELDDTKSRLAALSKKIDG